MALSDDESSDEVVAEETEKTWTEHFGLFVLQLSIFESGISG